MPSTSPIRMALIVLTLSFAANALGQNSLFQEPHMNIPRVSVAPTIDGVIAPGEWVNAATVNELYQVSPVEFAEAAESTVFHWMYDEEAIYVAAYAYDSDPSSISAFVLNQGGNLSNEDRLGVLINPHDNNRTAYKFVLNANGVRDEGLFSGTVISFDWDGVWDGAAMQLDDGWSAEWSIPFKTLSFDPENDTWRINVTRDIPRYNQSIGWLSANGDINPTAMVTMTGIRDVSQGRGIDFIPSFSATTARARLAGNTTTELNPSLDINYKLTPSINLTLTWNTDFAGTELDGRQLNLDRFSPSLPEQRSFFLTDFDIFQFGSSSGGGASNGAPFFSRRIGPSTASGNVDIVGGAKLSGRIGEYDFGTLVIRQAEYSGVDATDLVIARVSRSILSESALGFIATYGDPESNDHSSTVGVDFNYLNSQFLGDRQLNFLAWAQNSQSQQVSDKNSAWRIEASLPSAVGWEGSLSVTDIQENFDPRLGFVNRPGVRSYNANIEYRKNLEGDSIQQYGANLRLEQFNYLDNNELQSRLIQFRPLRLQTHAGAVLALMLRDYTENLRPGDTPFRRLGTSIPVDEYRHTRPRLFYRTSGARALAVDGNVEWGDFYTGSRLESNVGLVWQMSRDFSVEVELDYNKYEFSDVTAEVTQVELGLDYSFNSSLSLSTAVQYDDLSRNIGINSRLRWNMRSGQDIWFVINHSMEDLDADGRFVNLDTQAAFKIRFTHRI